MEVKKSTQVRINSKKLIRRTLIDVSAGLNLGTGLYFKNILHKESYFSVSVQTEQAQLPQSLLIGPVLQPPPSWWPLLNSIQLVNVSPVFRASYLDAVI